MGKYIDVTNQTFGSLTALYPTYKNGRFAWHCRCECGKEVDVDSGNLRSGKVKSCGCQKAKIISQKTSKDLTGKQFNKLTVLGQTDARKNGAIVWKCQCECGSITYVPTGNLVKGHTTSCGCNLKNCGHKLELTGKKFGRLTVLKHLGVKNQETIWECKCDCGNIVEAIGWHLNTGLKQSCGCLKSKGEQKIAEILTSHNISFEREKTFSDCLSPNGVKLKFDFFVNNQYLIEYDGEQHFISRNTGWSTEENLKKVQEYDKIKNEWCMKHDIPLIRIPYTLFNNITIKDLVLKE